MLSWHEDWGALFENIPRSDKAALDVGGFVNCHNCHYWALDEIDSKMAVERTQARSKATVSRGVTAIKIIGPCLLRGTMDKER